MANGINLISDPHATNRGVSSKVFLSIDWISCTFKDSKKLSYPQELSKEKVECKPFNGYNLGSQYVDGRVELVHTTRKEMGSHVVMSGSCLREVTISPEVLLSHFIEHGAMLTRLDIAVDCHDCGLKPSRATEEIENDRVKTLSRQFPTWHDAKIPGYTQYIGKKSSTAFCRIYDKAAEMGSEQEWTRVECVFNGKRAMDAGQWVLRGKDYRGLVRGFVDFPEWNEWKTVMSVDACKTKSPRSISNTKRWLLSSAATSLARELYLDGDDAFYFQFIDAMRFHLDKLRGEIEMEEDSKVS